MNNEKILYEIIKLCREAQWDERNNEYPHCTMRVEWDTKHPRRKNRIEIRFGVIATLKNELWISVNTVHYEVLPKKKYIDEAVKMAAYLLSDEIIPPPEEWVRV